MKNLILVFLIVFFYVSCSKDKLHNLKLTDITLYKFNKPTELSKWDTLDGPDIFITISINNSVVFISDKFENLNINSAPVHFNLPSNIFFQQSQDEITLNAYDSDLNSEQLIETNLPLTPGIVSQSPYSEIISCSVCIAEWQMTYEIVQ